MNIKDIIKICLVKMGEENFVDNDVYTDTQQKTVRQLVDAFNVAYTDATSFMPLIHTEEVVAQDRTINLASLTKQIIHPVRLEDKNGVKRRYHVLPTALTTDFNGEGKLTYAYAPNTMDIDDMLEDFRFTAEILADGTLGVYYFTLRVFDLAEAYDQNFREGVKRIKYKGREMTIKERRWSA